MLRLRAYAKINLGLRILDQRDDGYHNLETVFHRIDLFDELWLSRSSKLTLECKPAGLPTDEQNLCYRAALLLGEHLGRTEGTTMILFKNIPSGAGLGGGSADAAAALLGLAHQWHAQIPFDQLQSIALRLGSDVPYFLREGSAYATGRGEILDYFHLRVPYWIVVVYPNVPISTAWAYRQLRSGSRSGNSAGAEPRTSLREILQNDMSDVHTLDARLRNDFEPLVFGAHEQVDRVRRALHDAGAGSVHLSGSGSAVYALFPDEQKARVAAGIFERDWFVSVTPAGFDPSLETFGF